MINNGRCKSIFLLTNIESQRIYYQLVLANQTISKQEKENKLFYTASGISMTAAKANRISLAQNWLLEAKMHCHSTATRIVFLQNISCLQKIKKAYSKALTALEEAQQLATNQKGYVSNSTAVLAECLISQAAVLSAMKQHSKALIKARKSARMITNLSPLNRNMPHFNHLLTLSLYNEAVEHQHLGHRAAALEAFQQCQRLLSNDHGNKDFADQVNAVIDKLSKRDSSKSRIKAHSQSTQLKDSIFTRRRHSVFEMRRNHGDINQNQSYIIRPKCGTIRLHSHRSTSTPKRTHFGEISNQLF